MALYSYGRARFGRPKATVSTHFNEVSDALTHKYHFVRFIVMALCSYGPIWSWPYVFMALCSYGPFIYGHIWLWHYVVMTLYSYGPIQLWSLTHKYHLIRFIVMALWSYGPL